MTENKPMMIDGIDVKECTCFSNWHTIMTGAGIVYKEIENCCTPKQKPCKDIKNCCFKKLAKQLTRKTQECEELKVIRKKLYEFNKELIKEKFKIHTKGIKDEKKLERIRDICKNGVYDEFNMPLDECSVILQIIDEVE